MSLIAISCNFCMIWTACFTLAAFVSLLQVLFCKTVKAEEQPTVKTKSAIQAQTKDDAYDVFMKEMEGFL